MSNVRELQLRNRNGQIFDFMRKDAFLHDISGFGWGVTPETKKVGDNFIVTNEAIEDKDPSGTLAAASYAVVEEFRSFTQVGGLTLCYKPPIEGLAWRFMDCYVSYDVNEIDPRLGILELPVTFKKTSQWYESTILYRPSLQIDRDTGKVYGGETYTDAYKYEYRYQDSTSGSITIPNRRLPSYFKITFIGPVKNPEYRLYYNNTVIKTGKIKCTIQAGHKLIINTDPSDGEIYEYNENDERILDHYGHQDWTTDVIFAIPPGEHKMTLTQESTDLPTAYIEVFRRV